MTTGETVGKSSMFVVPTGVRSNIVNSRTVTPSMKTHPKLCSPPTEKVEPAEEKPTIFPLWSTSVLIFQKSKTSSMVVPSGTFSSTTESSAPSRKVTLSFPAGVTIWMPGPPRVQFTGGRSEFTHFVAVPRAGTLPSKAVLPEMSMPERSTSPEAAQSMLYARPKKVDRMDIFTSSVWSPWRNTRPGPPNSSPRKLNARPTFS
mmetsp:Transcript_8851/g.17293  ORF Transcript_8851/g.17293 Transcript_8851/m.17293 type:complete len:203 (-) Transcript_8851:531-1139(-)